MQNKYKENDKKRDLIADYVKAYACLLVVIGHVILGVRKGANNQIKIPIASFWIEQYIWTFHVSLFMFISGYIYNKCGKWHSKSTRLKFLTHKLINLGIPYLIFSCIYIVINNLMSSSVNTKNQISDIFMLWIKPVAQYWFLYSLLWIFFLFVILDKKFKNWEIIVIIALASYFLSCINLNIGIFDATLKSSIVFGIGVETKKLYSKNKTILNLFVEFIFGTIVGCMLLYLGETKYWFGNQVARMAGIYASISLIVLITHFNIIKKFFSFICKYSFQIYLLHTFFTAGTRIVFMKFGVTSYFLHLICGIIVGVVGPIIISVICDRIYPLKFIFSPEKILKDKIKI